jgi:Domain of unknown function (DUF4383)
MAFSVRNFALIAGIVYIVVGVLGFVPALLSSPPPGAPSLRVPAEYGYLFGLFPVNVLHSLVHVAIGIWGVIAWRTLGAARTFAASVAIIFAVLTILGLIPRANTLFGILPLFSHDIWLHALTAIIAAYFGFARGDVVEERRDPVRRAA